MNRDAARRVEWFADRPVSGTVRVKPELREAGGMGEDDEVGISIPPDLLAAAEEWLGHYAGLNVTEGAIHADIVRAELARLRAIEAAAVEYLDECDSPAPDYTMRKILRDRLSAAVRARQEGEKR